MTKRLEILERSPVRTSVRPSLKYSCSGSLLMLTKGNTTIDGLSGNGSATGAASGLSAESWGLGIRSWGLGIGRKRDLTAMIVATMSTRVAIAAIVQERWAMPALQRLGRGT